MLLERPILAVRSDEKGTGLTIQFVLGNAAPAGEKGNHPVIQLPASRAQSRLFRNKSTIQRNLLAGAAEFMCAFIATLVRPSFALVDPPTTP